MRAEMKILKRTLDSQRTAAAPPVSSNGASVAAPPVLPPSAVQPRGLRPYGIVAAATALLAGLAIGWFLHAAHSRTEPAIYQQLTFRRGSVRSARFTPNGQSVVYGAAWEGKATELFITSPESATSRSLDRHGEELMSVSSTGGIALLTNVNVTGTYTQSGTLARMPINGGDPREILEGVQWADWSPDGKQMAIVRDMGGKNRLEFPIGKVIHETPGWISHPRVSPDGTKVAFLEHPQVGDDSGGVHVIDLEGKDKDLADDFLSVEGLAWAPGGKEIWFAASTTGGNARSLDAVTLSGHRRIVTRVPAALQLEDIWQDGKALPSRQSWRRELSGLTAGMTKEQDFSWLDYSFPAELSSDGKRLLFDEEGSGGGAGYSVYLRKTAEDSAVRLGDGESVTLSPDGKWVLALTMSSPAQLILLPSGAGDAQQITHDGLYHSWARWLPDSQGIVFTAKQEGHGARIYLQKSITAPATPVSPEGIDPLVMALAPDGSQVAGIGADGKAYLYSLTGAPTKSVPGLLPSEQPMEWSADRQSISGYRRPLSDLYLVEGLK